MPVRITCRNTQLSDTQRNMILKKVERLNRYFEKVDRIDVIFTGEKNRCKCEINVHAPHFTSSSSVEGAGDDELTCFDKAIKVAQRQVKSTKTRRVDRKKKAGKPSRNGYGAGAEEEAEEIEA